MTLFFATNQGTTTNLVLKHGTTVGEALKLYLKRVGRPDFIDNIEGKLWFLYNSRKLEYTDNRKIEDVFPEGARIIVNDIQ